MAQCKRIRLHIFPFWQFSKVKLTLTHYLNVNWIKINEFCSDFIRVREDEALIGESLYLILLREVSKNQVDQLDIFKLHFPLDWYKPNEDSNSKKEEYFIVISSDRIWNRPIMISADFISNGYYVTVSVVIKISMLRLMIIAKCVILTKIVISPVIRLIRP